ncbi:MAG: hypothetical protein K0Q73_6539 [Paenibacillus sp.]|nr:hypothetical protein [Paenibacillus sp.]
MSAYVQFGVVLALLSGAGWLFIKRSASVQKSSTTIRLLRWTGYGLIAMTMFLIVFGVVQYFEWESHSIGH